MKEHTLLVAKADDEFKAQLKLAELVQVAEKEGFEVVHFTVSQTGFHTRIITMAAVMTRDSEEVAEVEDLQNVLDQISRTIAETGDGRNTPVPPVISN